MRSRTRVLGVIIFFSLHIWGPAEAQFSRNGLLRSVEVSKLNDDFIARIEFTTGMQYLSHIPPDRGKEVKISLGAPVSLQRELGDLRDQERISPHGVDSLLDDVLLDISNPTKPLLIVQFTKKVTFEVRGGSDFRSVVIVFRPVAALTTIPAEAEKPAEVGAAAPVTPARSTDQTAVGRLYNGAREAYVSGDYNRTIQLATSAVERGTPEEFRDALELLGMAREAKGQLAHATAEYERYINLYGKTSDVSRVKQRLDAILTAALPAAPKTEKERVARRELEPAGWRYQRSGGASVYYYNDSLKTDDNPSQTTRSSLVADANISARVSKGGNIIESRFNGSYEYDLKNDDPDNITRVSEAYVGWSNHDHNFKGLVGRESRSTDGVAGRYDGVRLSKRISKKVNVNLIGGFPVESTKDSVDTDRPFYGVSMDLGNFKGQWDFNVFFIDRYFDGLSDRRAVGGEVRYFKNGLSVFGYLDYDILFKEINTALLLGNWVHGDSTVFFNADYRRSPALSLKNALLGQPDPDLDDLKNSLSTDEIEELARRHTADSTYATLGYTRTLNPSHQISVDATASKLGEIEGSEFFPATPATSTEYYYNLQWITNSIFKKYDNYILGARYEDLDRVKRYTVLVNARIPAGKWRFNPRLSWATSESHDGLDTEDKLKASFNVIYRFNRDAELEFEVGTERITDEGPEFSGDTDINYFLGGFRKYF